MLVLLVRLFLESMNSGFNLLQQFLSVFELPFVVLHFLFLHVCLPDLLLEVFVVPFPAFEAQLQGVYLLSLVLDSLLEVGYLYGLLVDLFYV